MHFELTVIKSQMSSLCTLFNIRFEMPIMSDAIKLIIHAAVYCNIRCSSCTDCIQRLKEYGCFFLRWCYEYAFKCIQQTDFVRLFNYAAPNLKLCHSTHRTLLTLPTNANKSGILHLNTALRLFMFYLLNCAFRSKCCIILSVTHSSVWLVVQVSDN
jgi:hypothetical protein